MNRPLQMNLLTLDMLGALQNGVRCIAIDPGVRVVVLAGGGQGLLRRPRPQGDPRAHGLAEKVEALFDKCSRMMLPITQLPQPVIARVHGAAAAAGCQLVAQCDLAVASVAAKFTTPGVNWGFFCSTPGVAVGRNLLRKHAMEMLLTGDLVGRAEGARVGPGQPVVPAEGLDAASGLAGKASPRSLRCSRGRQAGVLPADGSRRGAGLRTGEGSDRRELRHTEGRQGMDAFIEKRDPPGRSRQQP